MTTATELSTHIAGRLLLNFMGIDGGKQKDENGQRSYTDLTEFPKTENYEKYEFYIKDVKVNRKLCKPLDISTLDQCEELRTYVLKYFNLASKTAAHLGKYKVEDNEQNVIYPVAYFIVDFWRR
ncbi:MAG: hypothetical protein HC880_02765 [Bacteroidia bacterium]|nr:hypothetical protein [Bacteroidia bacterium]